MNSIEQIPPQHQHHHHQNNMNNNEQLESNGNNSGKAAASAPGTAAGCRQSSTRWTPTTEQIRILKDLYYNYGIRSPSAEQIQRISARLRQYGKIEGKNVFYWFQNHKARERQKKRFLSDHPHSNNNNISIAPPASGIAASSSSSAPGLLAVGQMTNYGYSSVAMEKNFRDFSMSAAVAGNSVNGGPMGHNFGWIAVDPYSPSRSLFEKRAFYGESAEEDNEEDDEEEEEEGEGDPGRGIETLPLFPMRGDDSNDGAYCTIKRAPNGDHGWHSDVYMGASRASLELSLNSYSGWSPASP